MEVMGLFEKLLNKKNIALVICLILIVSFSTGIFADDFNEDYPLKEIFSIETSVSTDLKPPKIEAGAAIVMDMKSGRVLYEKNAHARKAIASTTKIMTAIVALERGNLEDKVKVSKRAANIGGSTINLKEGEEWTLKELLYGLMLRSGNDAAIAIAEHIGGSVEGFAALMNEKARELGLKNTQFKTPHGLDTPGHYSTAYELAQLTRYALNNPIFSQIVGTQNISVKGRSFYTTNEMLGAYPGADGVKTGYTGQAGRCLVTSATRNNMRLISVVLNCSSRTVRAKNSRAILDYAFNNYRLTKLLDESDNITEIQVSKGKAENVSVVPEKGIEMPLTEEEKSKMEMNVCLYYDKLNAPVLSDFEVGYVEFTANGNTIAKVALKTGKSVEKKRIIDYYRDIVGIWYRLMKLK
ncbi:D-alanyl-D-alanine carboxypeptidase [Acetivibrio clariflavus DSM 19732]|uniref:serine-type D-Ala-D-Ala carboxypeptidase n=2 Tax=Acetivibrio clariflavus TaxID=288965 RepID=G8LSQ5_ACECE|nr:D-alanyl-D-alanine carboxypeptidase [Acetivibrio clariflavus DSM 19732]